MISRKIKLGKSEYLVIDLTHPLGLDQEVYPGDPRPKRSVFTDMEETGWHHYIHELSDHHFQPHGDAPNHQNPELMDRGFEVFDLDYCFNRAIMIDLADDENAIEMNGIRFLTRIALEHLAPYERVLTERGAILLRSGYDRWLENNYPHDPQKLPYLTPDAAAFLASFWNLKVVGTDSMTVDPDGSHTAHRLLKEKLIVESMVHLHEIPKNRSASFDLQTSPVRIKGATGGPVTSYAYFEI